MNYMTKKLRSDRGASITFSLLLFLVCAVLSTVIIVASTAAAGRMSSLVENDQRYYAVTSAAQLLEDVLGDETITIVKEDVRTRTIGYDENGNEDKEKSSLSDIEKTNIYLVDGKGYDATATKKALYKDGALQEFSPSDIAEYMAYQYAKLEYPDLLTGSNGTASAQNSGLAGSNDGQKKESTIELQFDVSDDLSTMNVSLTGTLDKEANKDGSLTLMVASSDQKYKLKMNFEADTKESKDELSEEVDAAGERDKNQVVEKVKDYTNTSLSWQLTGVELYR